MPRSILTCFRPASITLTLRITSRAEQASQLRSATALKRYRFPAFETLLHTLIFSAPLQTKPRFHGKSVYSVPAKNIQEEIFTNGVLRASATAAASCAFNSPIFSKLADALLLETVVCFCAMGRWGATECIACCAICSRLQARWRRPSRCTPTSSRISRACTSTSR